MKNSILTEYDEAFVMAELSRESYEDGVENGLDSFAKLTQILLDENKTNELSRASTDKEYRRQLLEKYNL